MFLSLDLQSRPTRGLPRGRSVYGKSDGAQKRVLGRFHPPKKIGEMNDTSHVGFGKLHAPLLDKFKAHTRIKSSQG